MTLPGVSYTIQSTAPPRSVPTGTARWFVAGVADRGSITEALKVTSMTQFVRLFGDRLASSYLYDALDVFFREGGSEAYVGRVVGPTPALATINIYDQSGSTAPGDVALVATAKEHGAWANGLNVAVTVDGTDFTLTVTHDDDDTVSEVSPVLADRAAAVTWSADSDYITITLGASNEDPRAGTYSLAGGDDDTDNATETEWADALDLFVADLGGGQVSMPGRTTDASHEAVLAHAVAFNRTALLDAEDSATSGTLTATAENGRAEPGAKFGAMFAPWVVCPGVLTGTRTVPPSAAVAGLMARSDGQGNAPNVAAAGDNGELRYCTALSQSAWTDTVRETLNDAGVNVFRVLYGRVRLYGYRTLVDPDTAPAWLHLGGSREVSYILAEAQRIAETFVFDQIDGRGRTIGRWAGALKALLATEYDRDALYGDTMEDAFIVDVGPSVNTPETIAEGKLRAVIAARTSPMAERVEIEVVKVLTTDTI